jgi:hypothetical protein
MKKELDTKRKIRNTKYEYEGNKTLSIGLGMEWRVEV